MIPLVILGCLVLAPPLFTMLLRSNGMLVFMSVCMGDVLATYVAGDASAVVEGMGRAGALVALQWTQLALIGIPVFLTLLLSRKNLKGIKLIMGVVASAAAGGLTALLAVSYLPSTLQKAMIKTQSWHQLNNLQTPLILVGAACVILYLFMVRWKLEPQDKRRK